MFIENLKARAKKTRILSTDAARLHKCSSVSFIARLSAPALIA